MLEVVRQSSERPDRDKNCRKTVQSSGSVAQLEECSHGKQEVLSSSFSWATLLSFHVTFGGSVWVHG